MFLRSFIIALTLALGHIAVADELQNSVGMKLRLIEAGRFERGDRDTNIGFGKDHADFNTAGDEAPRHAVVLTKPFYLATTEVTVAQLRQFVDETGYKTSAENNPRGAVGWDPTPPQNRERYVATFRDGDEFDWQHPGFEQADNHPVVGVSFADAKAYCAWLSKKEGTTYRLPTEAEWEYAARAGTDTYFSFGDKYRGVIQRFANLGNVELERAFPDRVRRQWLIDIDRDPPDKHVFTAPVASYEPNPWGLFDMHGNVWEWCEDRYLDTAYTPIDRPGHQQPRKRAIDPLNDKPWLDAGDWRVIRGGSWFNAPIQCRSGVRGYFEAGDAACYIGFRVVRDASAEQIATAKVRFEKSEAARATLAQLAERLLERRDGRLSIELNNQRGEISPELVAALGDLDEPFDLQFDARGNLTGEQLAAAIASPQLRGLTIYGIGPNVTDDDFALLANYPLLEWLQLNAAPKLSDRLFAHLAKLDQLEHLQLESPGITDAGLQSLAELRRLKSLRLNGTASQGLALKRSLNSPLETFSCSQLSDEGAALLAHFTTLREVSIGGSPITGAALAKIAKLPQLTNLDLSGCEKLTDADFAALGDAYNLAYLQLDRAAAGDKGAAALARLNNLTNVQLGSPALTDAGMRDLCGIVSLRSLTVTRDADQLTDAALADLWRLANLEYLSLAAPRLTGSGLANLDELPSLRTLRVASPQLADFACEHIATSISLEQLHLGDWQSSASAELTDAALRHLAGAEKLQSVSIFRKGTQVTDDGVAELRRERPNLKINDHR